MSMRAVIERIEREMFERAEKEENVEIFDVTNLKDYSDNARRYIKGRGGESNDISNAN